jgi:hypothetical protein
VTIKTTGITEFKFIHNQTNFLVRDSGGQRNERYSIGLFDLQKKWPFAVENAHAIIFVESLKKDFISLAFPDRPKNLEKLQTLSNFFSSLKKKKSHRYQNLYI